MTSYQGSFWCSEDGSYHRLDGPAVENKQLGYRYWYHFGKYHRENGPAVEIEGEDGRQEWWYHGQRHNTIGPALAYNNGYRREWWYLGMLHRIDGPAILTPHEQMWYFHGNLHRWNGPAIEYSGGKKEWRIGGLLHRVDGPAVIIPGIRNEYYQKGILHRLDGPAVECEANGVNRYYINGKYYEEEVYNKVTGICKKFGNKLKIRLRKNYEQELLKTELCDEVNLYKIIAGYMI